MEHFKTTEGLLEDKLQIVAILGDLGSWKKKTKKIKQQPEHIKSTDKNNHMFWATKNIL